MSVGKGIVRGKKNLKGADEEMFFNMEFLKKNHGLLIDSIWHEAFDRVGIQEREYLISCLRKEEKVTSPRIKLSTIHAAKGGESENVVVLTDMANSTWVELGKNPDNENRTFYVAVTRTKENLHIVMPKTHKHFKIAY
jgi:superfamily I DNA/RNA helicase